VGVNGTAETFRSPQLLCLGRCRPSTDTWSLGVLALWLTHPNNALWGLEWNARDFMSKPLEQVALEQHGPQVLTTQRRDTDKALDEY
jgi:hypothetical protein